MMKKIILFTAITVVSICIHSSCSKDDTDRKSQDTITLKWKDQLNKVLTIGNQSLNGSSIKMIGYKETGDLVSAEAIKQVKNELLSENQLLPNYSPGNLKNLTLLKISEVKSREFRAKKI